MRILRLVERRSPLRHLAAVAGPAAATGIGLAMGSGRTTAAALVYLLGVLAVAAAAGLWSGVVASVLSFLGLNFFFTPPRLTFTVDKSDDIIALIVFLSVSLAVSTLVAAGLAQRARAERREYEARMLHAISSRLLGADDLDRALGDLARHLRSLFALARCEVRIRDGQGALEVRAAHGDDAPDATGVEVPITTGEREFGKLVLVPGEQGLGEAEQRVAAIFARQTASALERAALEHEARESRLAAEANRVRRALLSAVSHDLRTPLASIKAALTGLVPDDGSAPSGADAEELLRTALEETGRLERVVTNLLDLTRIRSGALSPDRVVVPADEVIGDALAGLRAELAGHRVSVIVRPDTPALDVDPVQMGQVFRNVLENAAKFAPAESEIRVAVSRWHSSVEVRIADRGPGIPARERGAVFEEFYRSGDARAAGTGLGLTVAKAIVEAHGGVIWIEEAPGGGTTVAVRLPAVREPG